MSKAQIRSRANLRIQVHPPFLLGHRQRGSVSTFWQAPAGGKMRAADTVSPADVTECVCWGWGWSSVLTCLLSTLRENLVTGVTSQSWDTCPSRAWDGVPPACLSQPSRPGEATGAGLCVQAPATHLQDANDAKRVSKMKHQAPGLSLAGPGCCNHIIKSEPGSGRFLYLHPHLPCSSLNKFLKRGAEG